MMASKKDKQNHVLNVAGMCLLGGLVLSLFPRFFLFGWGLLIVGLVLVIVAYLDKDPDAKKQGKKALVAGLQVIPIAAIAFGIICYNGGLAKQEPTVTLPDGTQAAGDEGTSRRDPLPLGSTVANGQWAYTVTAVDLHADQHLENGDIEILHEIGDDIVQVSVTATYIGDEPRSGTPDGQVAFLTQFYLPSGAFNAKVAPSEVSGLAPGESLTRDIQFATSLGDVSKGTLAVKAGQDFKVRFVAVQ